MNLLLHLQSIALKTEATDSFEITFISRANVIYFLNIVILIFAAGRASNPIGQNYSNAAANVRLKWGSVCYDSLEICNLSSPCSDLNLYR
jgi:hypothetical protein